MKTGALVMIVLAGIAGSARAAPASASASSPTAACEAMAHEDFSKIPDAPTHVSEAQLVAAGKGAPLHCRVRGYIAPQVGFEIYLPASEWNGKFIEVGCGGFCGSIDPEACKDPLRRGYACIASDMGHKGEDGLWAYNNLQAKIDWGYRGPHVAALAGKAITQQYYSRAPHKSYFSGCSTGGRQAMVEAQRFPWDFDGIIAGAPPLNFTANSLAQLWAARATKDKEGRSLLSAADVQLLHRAVLAQCDLDDGIRDGVVGNPAACKFDPAMLACKGGATTNCLTENQLAAVKKVYAGPFTSMQSTTRRAGYMRGSELGWTGAYFAADGGPGFLDSYAAEKLRYLAFFPDAGPQWKAADLNFDRDYKRLGAMESLYSATNPDLREFKRNGGKLIVYQGWNDTLEPPAAITDYYETVERVIGTPQATEDFFRLFMIPGMGHCGGGEGASVVDYLSSLEGWVEKGQKPDKVIGAHLKPDDPEGSADLTQHRNFSRPVYPYPMKARYLGHGDPNDAASFGIAKP